MNTLQDHSPTIPSHQFTNFTQVSSEDVLQIINKMGPSSSPLDPIPTTSIKTVAEVILQDLTSLVNKSLTTGEIPQAWKKGVITPLLKKPDGDISQTCNYRPVTQLRLLARVTEAITTQQIQCHLESNNILDDRQSGFRPGRGTEMAVMDMREAMLKGSDKSHNQALILLDLSAAFDTVDHNLLLQQLSLTAGITGLAAKWFRSFLSHRTQQVKMGEEWSKEYPLECGVPQGSAISPILFNVYVRPLVSILQQSGLTFQLYADDIQILVDLDSQDREKLIPCLTNIQDWMSHNSLQLNRQKTELLLIEGSTKKPIPPIPWPQSWGPMPTPVITARNLGIIMDSKTRGDKHTSVTVQSCNHHLNKLIRILPLLTHQQKVTVVQALIGSKISYGILTLLGAPKSISNKLQKVQNRAIRLIFNLSNREHISQWRIKLRWMKIATQIEFRACLWVWKAIHKQGPGYLQNWIILPKTQRQPRRQHTWKAVTLRYQKTSRGGKTMGRQGVTFWNALPQYLRATPLFSQFKRALKEHLLTRDAAHLNVRTSPKTQLPSLTETFTLPRTDNISNPQSVHQDTSATTEKNARISPKTQPPSIIETLTPSRTDNISNPQSIYQDTSAMMETNAQAQSDSNQTQMPVNHRSQGNRPRPCWGVTSPPLPRRDNQDLIARMTRNKLMRHGPRAQ